MTGFRPIITAMLLLCSCEPSQDSTTLFQDVGMSFESCNEAEIKNANRRYGIMPALAVCGSNNVANFAWNPSGTHLYFDLTMTANVLDASSPQKTLQTLPVDQPTGRPTWLTDHRLAVPVVPKHDDPSGTERISVYNLRSRALDTFPVRGLTAIQDLVATHEPDTVLFSALNNEGERAVYRMAISSGEASPAFPWNTHAVATFTYEPASKRVVIGDGTTVRVFEETGHLIAEYSGTRGSINSSGEWLALERDGEEVSIFYQRSWENMTERERQILEKKAERMGERFPEWFPKKVTLPALEFIHVPTGNRGESRSFFGTKFQWYGKTEGWGSFLLWGYEGKQLNTNVQLGDLRMRLGAIKTGSQAIDDIRILPASKPGVMLKSSEGSPPDDEELEKSE